MKNDKITGIDSLRLNIPEMTKEIVNRQYLMQPEFRRYGDKGIYHSMEDAKYNMEYLLASIETESPTLLIEYNKWANRLFDGIKLPIQSLLNFYQCTLEVLKTYVDEEKLDINFYRLLEEYISLGMNALTHESLEEVQNVENSDNPMHEQLKIYSDFVFAGEKNSAIRYFSELAKDPAINIKALYRNIVEPFQKELGRLWHTNQINVAQEHYATSVSQMAMTMLYERIFSTPKNGKVLLGACTQGELHEFGIRMVCDYMESCGWDTTYLGANMHEGSIIEMILSSKPDIVALSCTMVFNLPKTKSLVNAIKTAGITTPVIVGGYPFNQDKDLWRKIGASGCSANFEEAYMLSEIMTAGTKV